MKKIHPALAAVAASTLLLGACGAAPEQSASGDASATGGTDAAGSDYKACLVSDAGGWDDRSFNQSAYEGLQQAAEELGIQTNTMESTSDSDFVPNVDRLVQDNCNLVIGVGFNLAEAVNGASEANPDVDFALVDSYLPEGAERDNFRALVFNTAEAAYLGGYAAAASSQTGTVATFGGLQIPSVSIFMDGFADGVARYNADKGADVQLVGWDKDAQQGAFTGTFERQDEGSALAGQQLSQGADVIMPVAGPVGLGAASAVQDAGTAQVVGVDSDWTESTEYGDIVLTSVEKGISEAVVQAIKDGQAGNFTSEPYVGTLANEGVSLAPLTGTHPDGLQEELDAIKQEIIDGTTVVETENAPA